jgi:hypothetical protein
MVRAAVVLSDVSVFARLRVKEFAVEVSIVMAALELVIAKVLEPVPCVAETFVIAPATP